MEGELQDWELLHSSDSPPLNSPLSDVSARSFDDVEVDSRGMIRADYFSLHNSAIYAKPDDASEDGGSLESENPSWIDPETETRFGRKHPSEFWSDSSSDRSDERKLGDFDARNQLMCFHGTKSQGLETGGAPEGARFCSLHLQSLSDVESAKNPLDFEKFDAIRAQDKGLGKYLSDSGGEGPVPMESRVVEEENRMTCGDVVKMEDGLGSPGGLSTENGNVKEAGAGEDNSSGHEGIAITSVVQSNGEGGKKGAVWWKVPFELLNYCLFKVSPVWSFSVAAAAVMGFIILGRRLYKIKKKSRSLQLKVALDDKKLSQFANRAARLNEAFSVVRRVPIIRPAVPMPGMNPWPVMSLR